MFASDGIKNDKELVLSTAHDGGALYALLNTK